MRRTHCAALGAPTLWPSISFLDFCWPGLSVHLNSLFRLSLPNSSLQLSCRHTGTLTRRRTRKSNVAITQLRLSGRLCSGLFRCHGLVSLLVQNSKARARFAANSGRGHLTTVGNHAPNVGQAVLSQGIVPVMFICQQREAPTRCETCEVCNKRELPCDLALHFSNQVLGLAQGKIVKAVDLEVQPARATAHKGAKQQPCLKFDTKQIVVRDLVRSQKRSSRSETCRGDLDNRKAGPSTACLDMTKDQRTSCWYLMMSSQGHNQKECAPKKNWLSGRSTASPSISNRACVSGKRASHDNTVAPIPRSHKDVLRLQGPAKASPHWVQSGLSPPGAWQKTC